MDTNSFNKKKDVEDSNTETKSNKKDSRKLEDLDNKLMSKDDEIKQLKAKLAEAQKSNKEKKGDIRSEVNRLGDVKRICIGVDDFGRRLWKKATDLTDADIERRKEYIESIKQMNAKKY